MKSARVLRCVSFFLFGLAATGCASVKVSVPGVGAKTEIASLGYSERVALNDAADALGVHPWGDTPESGFVSVLFGTISENDQQRAVSAYIASIEARGEDPVAGVFADADVSLARARQVVETGRQALESMSPLPSDVATLETAISDTRECRTMYIAALETLGRREDGVSRGDILVMRDAFTQTIDDMGRTADLVADRLASAQAQERFAQRTLGNAGGE